MIIDMQMHGAVTQASSSRGASSREEHGSVTHSFEGLQEALLGLRKIFSTATHIQNAICVTDRPQEVAFNLLQQHNFSKFPRFLFISEWKDNYCHFYV